jgi:hypothetical protein
MPSSERAHRPVDKLVSTIECLTQAAKKPRWSRRHDVWRVDEKYDFNSVTCASDNTGYCSADDRGRR